MTEEISGNFDIALNVLIQSLVDLKYDHHSNKTASEMAWKILDNWDQNRGNDWFTSTKLKEQNKSKGE